MHLSDGVCRLRARVQLKTLSSLLKDVRAHCYCTSLVRTLFTGHARATPFSSARTESKTQQNIELMTCVNLVCEYFCWMLGDPYFFFGRLLPFLTLSVIPKNKKISVWEVLIISHILLKNGRIGTWIQVCVT